MLSIKKAHLHLRRVHLQLFVELHFLPGDLLQEFCLSHLLPSLQKGEAVQNLPAPLLDDLPLDALRLMNVLLQRAGRHDLGDEDDLLRVRQIKVGEEGEDVLVLERLEDVDLGLDDGHLAPCHARAQCRLRWLQATRRARECRPQAGRHLWAS